MDQLRRPENKQIHYARRKRLVAELKKEVKHMGCEPREMKKAPRTKLPTSKQRSLAWRVMKKSFWAEKHFPRDHKIRACKTCNNKEAYPRHKLFACKKLQPFWQKIYKIKGSERIKDNINADILLKNSYCKECSKYTR